MADDARGVVRVLARRPTGLACVARYLAGHAPRAGERIQIDLPGGESDCYRVLGVLHTLKRLPPPSLTDANHGGWTVLVEFERPLSPSAASRMKSAIARVFGG